MLSRQEQYRRRLIIKAQYFDIYNEDRLREVRRSFKETANPKAPEHRALLPYFLTHPGARRFVPFSLGNVGGYEEYGDRVWETYVDEDDPNRELHAMILAFGLSEVSSIPAHICWIGHEWTAQVSPDDVKRMAQDFQDLRNAGMWVSE